MKRVLCSHWLPEQAVWAFLAHLGFPTLVPQEKSFLFWLNNKSSIYQFKMPGYWPNNFGVSFSSTLSRSIKTKKRTWPLSSHLGWTSWSITHTCGRNTYCGHSFCSRWDLYFHVVAGATSESSSLLQNLCCTIFFMCLKTLVIGPAKTIELARPVCWLFHPS